MVRTIRHPHTLLVAEEAVYRDAMMEHRPAGRRIFRAARNEKWPRRHERLDLLEIHPLLDHHAIRAGARTHFVGRTGRARRPRLRAQIPWLPVVHVRTLLI